MDATDPHQDKKKEKIKKQEQGPSTVKDRVCMPDSAKSGPPGPIWAAKISLPLLKGLGL